MSVCACACACAIDSLLPIERAANARVVENHEKTSIEQRLSPARDSSPRTFEALCATRRGPTWVLESKPSRFDRSARAPARPRDDSADIRRGRRGRRRFIRRATFVRLLPASIGRRSRLYARTSWVGCSTLRLARRPRTRPSDRRQPVDTNSSRASDRGLRNRARAVRCAPRSSVAPMIPRTSFPRVASRPNTGRAGVRNTRIPVHGDFDPLTETPGRSPGLR